MKISKLTQIKIRRSDLIIENLANFNEGGKTGLEGAKNIDPYLYLKMFNNYNYAYSFPYLVYIKFV
jgi:hypothetical protein